MRGPSPSTRAPARAPGRGPRIPLPGFTRRTWAWGSLLRVPVRVSALLSVSGRGVACPHLGLVGHVSCSQSGAGLRTDHRGGRLSPPPSGPTLSPRLVSAAADLAPGFSAEAPLLAPCTPSICSRYPSSYPTRPELVPPSAAVPTTVGRSVGRLRPVSRGRPHRCAPAGLASRPRQKLLLPRPRPAVPSRSPSQGPGCGSPAVSPSPGNSSLASAQPLIPTPPTSSAGGLGVRVPGALLPLMFRESCPCSRAAGDPTDRKGQEGTGRGSGWALHQCHQQGAVLPRAGQLP